MLMEIGLLLQVRGKIRLSGAMSLTYTYHPYQTNFYQLVKS